MKRLVTWGRVGGECTVLSCCDPTQGETHIRGLLQFFERDPPTDFLRTSVKLYDLLAGGPPLSLFFLRTIHCFVIIEKHPTQTWGTRQSHKVAATISDSIKLVRMVVDRMEPRMKEC